MISPEAHCEFEWILLANSLRLSMDTRRYPSGISPFGSILSSEELSVYSAPIFLREAEAAGGGICLLTTSSSPTNAISVAAFLASSMGTFFCFWTPLNFDFFFWQFFFSTDCFRPIFPPFGIALCERFTWSLYEERNNTVLCNQAFQVWKYWTGMVLEGTTGTNEPLDFISVQKTPPKCICLKRLPWKRKTILCTLRKIELFFHFMDNFWCLKF